MASDEDTRRQENKVSIIVIPPGPIAFSQGTTRRISPVLISSTLVFSSFVSSSTSYSSSLTSSRFILVYFCLIPLIYYWPLHTSTILSHCFRFSPYVRMYAVHTSIFPWVHHSLVSNARSTICFHVSLSRSFLFTHVILRCTIPLYPPAILLVLFSAPSPWTPPPSSVCYLPFYRYVQMGSVSFP